MIKFDLVNSRILDLYVLEKILKKIEDYIEGRLFIVILYRVFIFQNIIYRETIIKKK